MERAPLGNRDRRPDSFGDPEDRPEILRILDPVQDEEQAAARRSREGFVLGKVAPDGEAGDRALVVAGQSVQGGPLSVAQWYPLLATEPCKLADPPVAPAGIDEDPLDLPRA